MQEYSRREGNAQINLPFAEMNQERMLGGKTPYLEDKSMLRSFFCLLLLATAFSSLSSCYHMPTDEDYSLVPSTNNPQVTRQRQDSLTPKVSY